MGEKGFLVVISAPSGGGKTTLLNNLLKLDGDFVYSISATTRDKRGREVQGRDYHFLTAAEFKKMKDDEQLVEWAEVHGKYYGTPLKPVLQWLDTGKVVFLDLDVDGGVQVKQKFGDDALLIFVKPPTYESLKQRLKSRNTETSQQIEKRLSRYPKEMKKGHQYDHQVVNEDIEKATKEILSIIKKHSKDI